MIEDSGRKRVLGWGGGGVVCGGGGGVFFFFKQKTAYEIVSRDWSSDVCSSDLTDEKLAGSINLSAPSKLAIILFKKEIMELCLP